MGARSSATRVRRWLYVGLAAVVGVTLVSARSGALPDVKLVARAEVGLPGAWFEPAVAVDRADPSVIAVTVMEAPRPAGHVRLFVSLDGGGSWLDRGRVFPTLDGDTVAASGDTTVAFDPHGALVVAGLLAVGDRSVVAVARSVDRGVSFTTVTVDRSEEPRVTSGPRPPADRLDKPWLTMSNDGGAALVWAHQRAGQWELQSAVSNDSGVSFAPPTTVDRDRGQPQFGVVAPDAVGGLAMTVWTRDGDAVVSRLGSEPERALSAIRPRGSVGPVVVDGRGGREACWTLTDKKVPSVLCADLRSGRVGGRVGRGEGLPAVVTDGAGSVLVTVKAADGREAVRVRVRGGASWSAPVDVVSWATASDLCVASCDADGVDADGGVPAIGDYHGLDVVTGGRVIVVTVEPGRSGNDSHLWALSVATGR